MTQTEPSLSSRSSTSISCPVLLVEDDLSLRLSLGQYLEDHGHRIVMAGTVREGKERLAGVGGGAGRPWLCILDLNLPDGSGLEILRQLVGEAGKGGQLCRVIVMTAFELRHLRPADSAVVLAGWLNK